MNVRKRTTYFLAGLLTVAVTLVAAGCGGGGDSSPTPAAAPKPPECRRSEYASWQKLANEIKAPVYCPSWLPQPLVGKFSGRFFNGRSVDPDRSYLVSFVWFEAGQGFVSEVHVNLRGYPGTTRIPICEDTLTVGGQDGGKKIPCFSDRQGKKRLGGVTATVYTANQGADHVARPLRVAQERLPVHALGARCRAVLVRPGHLAPRSDDAPARACRTHRHLAPAGG